MRWEPGDAPLGGAVSPLRPAPGASPAVGSGWPWRLALAPGRARSAILMLRPSAGHPGHRSNCSGPGRTRRPDCGAQPPGSEQPAGPDREEARLSPGLPAGGAHGRVTPLRPWTGGGKSSSKLPKLLRAFLISAQRPHLRSVTSTRTRRQGELAGSRAGRRGSVAGLAGTCATFLNPKANVWYNSRR